MSPTAARERVVAFAPGRVNLIGEHTDYNDGLALPFAIEEGVTVTATARPGDELRARALDHDGERDAFAHADIGRAEGWRAFVRGTAAELLAAGHRVVGAELEIAGDVPEGSGLSSSAALEVALCLALLGLDGAEDADRVGLAQLCSRVENDWVGASTGLLDQLASLLGRDGHALRIDFRTLDIRPVPFALAGWTLAILDSGEPHVHAGSGYNARRAECERARTLLGLSSLRDARAGDLGALPSPLDRRVRHVLAENARVEAAVRALEDGETSALGPLLDASHASLRDDYEASTDAVERAVGRLRAAGAAGARMVGGGFGGHVLGLFPPGVAPPAEARTVTPGDGARLVETVRSGG
ncbi:MAG TPA: galactokinase [Solirubrobacteraceae bacterium]|nr:galactokinase [Solirubrobacteraceae bacterium]